jgi:hypothetical protein
VHKVGLTTGGPFAANHLGADLAISRTAGMVRSDVCRMHSSRVGPPNLSPYRNDSITRSIAGCFRFFVLTQNFDLPPW